jgi:hypothetical protein
MPDVMYGAGVACDGCHTDMQFTQVGDLTIGSTESGPAECVDCHGDEFYGEMLTEWQDEIRERIKEISPDLDRLESRCRSARGSEEQIAKARGLLKSAQAKMSHVIVDGSYGAHNYEYVSSILDEVETEMEECREVLTAYRTSGEGSP